MADLDNLAFSPKDALIFVPTIGTSLAVCWEVGSFLPVGGAAFSLFSITEHVSFAVPALPWALACVIAVVPVTFSRKLNVWGKGSTRLFRLRLVTLAMFVFCAISALIFRTSVFIAFSAIFLLVSVASFHQELNLRRKTLAIVGILSLLLLAMAMGVDFTRARLNSEVSSEIVTNEGPIEAVLFRAGEKGLLIFDRNRGRFSFVRWDSVKKVDWLRIPMFHEIAKSSH